MAIYFSPNAEKMQIYFFANGKQTKINEPANPDLAKPLFSFLFNFNDCCHSFFNFIPEAIDKENDCFDVSSVNIILKKMQQTFADINFADIAHEDNIINAYIEKFNGISSFALLDSKENPTCCCFNNLDIVRRAEVQTSYVKKIFQSTNLINLLQLEKKQKKTELLKKKEEDIGILQTQFDALLESLKLNEKSNISIKDTVGQSFAKKKEGRSKEGDSVSDSPAAKNVLGSEFVFKIKEEMAKKIKKDIEKVRKKHLQKKEEYLLQEKDVENLYEKKIHKAVKRENFLISYYKENFGDFDAGSKNYRGRGEVLPSFIVGDCLINVGKNSKNIDNRVDFENYSLFYLGCKSQERELSLPNIRNINLENSEKLQEKSAKKKISCCGLQ